MYDSTTRERLEHTARWMRESAKMLRLLRDAVAHEIAEGNLAKELPHAHALDAAAIMSLTPVLSAAMVRLAKTLDPPNPGKSRKK